MADVNNYLVNVEVNFRGRLELSLETTASLCPDDVLHLVLEKDQQTTHTVAIIIHLFINRGAQVSIAEYRLPSVKMA